MKDSLTPAELKQLLDENANIRVLDVRLEEDRVDVAHPIPNAEWRNPNTVDDWHGDTQGAEETIVFCVKGAHVCKDARDALRGHGVKSRVLEGGIRAWCDYISSDADPN